MQVLTVNTTVHLTRAEEAGNDGAIRLLCLSGRSDLNNTEIKGKSIAIFLDSHSSN